MEPRIVTLTVLLAAAACSVGGGTGKGTDPVDPRQDGGPGTGPGPGPGPGPGGYGNAAPVDECNPSCGPLELCGSNGQGDGVDNDCNGEVDEICSCPATGVTKECFLGPPDRRGFGTCSDGVMTCSELLSWGPCVGGQSPEPEICDGADNDCNGEPDDTLTNCSTSLQCPGTQQALPLTSYPLNGTAIFPGSARSTSWTVECPPTVSPCPQPANPGTRDTEIFFFSSGSYRTRFTVVTDSGEELSCQWVIRVQGTGLRVELNWDTRGEGNGNTDVDLHLHRKSVPPGTTTGESEFFTEDDCYFSNCKGGWYDDEVRAAWDLPDTTDLAACQGAPHGEGDNWVEKGACYNPRLDVDVVSCNPAVTDSTDYDFCAPENINVDNPPVGAPYRVMVNYYSRHSYEGKTYPTVNLYCGGELRGSFGQAPIVVLRDGSSYGENNENWLVADVVFEYDSCGGLTCRVQPLGLVQDGPNFGPPWSF